MMVNFNSLITKPLCLKLLLTFQVSFFETTVAVKIWVPLKYSLLDLTENCCC
jgi:hypothetical protein